MRIPDSVLLVYSAREETPFGERASERMLDAITAALAAGGRESAVLRYSELHESFGDRVRGMLVFNLAYGYVDPRGRSFSQPHVARRLHMGGARLIGSSPDAQDLAQDKVACAAILASDGIATPHPLRSDLFDGDFVIRKPRCGACHRDVAILSASDALALEPSSDVLLQEYVSGPEFTVGVVDGHALPALRVVVGHPNGPTALGFTAGDVRLLSDSGAPAGLGTLAKRIGALLGLCDYYRIDVRMRGDVPVVLDVNSLPNLEPETSFLPLLASAAGWTYGDLVRAVVRAAEKRLTPPNESMVRAFAEQ